MIILNAVRNLCYHRIIQNPRPFYIRTVSTTNKKSEVIDMHPDKPKVIKEETHEDHAPANKRDWRSFGFDDLNEARDRMWAYSTNFFLIFCSLTCVFIIAYYPDAADQNWVQREAFIELRRREVLGLPLVDKNYVDPATVRLPPDEELDDDDIII